MPRTVRNSKLENRAARDRLPAQRKPYWHTLVPGALHLGYRKRRAGAPGRWTLRRYAATVNTPKRPLAPPTIFRTPMAQAY